jgi:uncharacterized protein YifE (UPF0438 family)
MKTLAELKREANAQSISAEMIYRYGEEIPERLRGIRKATRANTVAVFFQNSDGRESELSIKAASLIDYDGETLTIYEAGKREPNAEEKAILQAYEKAKAEHEKNNPFSDGYWHKVSFFNKHKDFQYLAGFETVRGKRYNYDGTITDNAIKGAAIIKYKIYHN